MTVAVVDTGVDSTAQDLQGRIAGGASFLNGVQGATTQDDNGHGTHVSGIIAAVQNNAVGVSGVAPGAHVMPLKALDGSGSGTFDDVANAFAYAGQNNIRIVNASLGGEATSQTLEQAIQDYPNTLDAVAAGNSGTDNDDPSTPFYPCDLPEANLVCVGASGQYAYADGTAMAAPMVTGTLALMLSHNPSLTAAQLKQDLLASVDPAPQLAGLSVTGGELDAAAAVAAAGGDGPYAAPGNRGLPTLSGDGVVVGSTLTADPGSWSRSPAGYSYQWQRCLADGCLSIPGATSPSYALAPSDLGASLDVVVTASNAVGSVQATSAITSPVGPPTPPTTGGSSTVVSPSPTPPSNPVAYAPVQRAALRLSHVALRGGRERQALVFTLSARARVQITVSGSSRARYRRGRRAAALGERASRRKPLRGDRAAARPSPAARRVLAHGPRRQPGGHHPPERVLTRQLPLGPNRSVLIRDGGWPMSTSHCAAASTNPVGPQI